MRSLLMVSLMSWGTGHARGTIGSHNSVYSSSYCQQHRCVLERVTTHNDGVDFLIYRYRLKDGSSLLVSRLEPLDPKKPEPRDNRVEAMTLELPKTLTQLQLERRLTQLINVGTGSSFKVWRFDFAHKCTRPGQFWYPYNGDELKFLWSARMARDYTLKVAGQTEMHGVTCIWEINHWRLTLHGRLIFPVGDGLYQVWPKAKEG